MKRLPAIALIVANVAVLCIVAFQDLGYYYILSVYWWETVIIGFYNLFRILVVCAKAEKTGRRIGLPDAAGRIFWALGLMFFFSVKFGSFVLFIGLLVFMAPGLVDSSADGDKLGAAIDSASAVGKEVFTAVFLLFISHGISFFMNFIKRREYRHSNVLVLLFWPYVRLALIVFVFVFASLAVGSYPEMGSATVFTLAVVILKLFVDAAMHQHEHRARIRKTQ